MHRSAVFVATVVFAIPLSAGAATTSDSCSSVAACVLGAQSSTGIGVSGVSKSGFGVEGTTSVAATTTAKARSGVYGKDTTNVSTQNFNSGVAGISNYGNGVSGTANDGNGVYGSSLGSYGVYGTSPVVAVYGDARSGQYGAGGNFVGGNTGVYGDGGATGGVFSTFSADNLSNQTAGANTIIAFGAELGEGKPNGNLFYGYGCYGNGSSSACYNTTFIDSAGNATFNSVTVASGQTINTKRADGKTVTSYGARSASPTIEDFGTGTMRNGVAFVALDKTYADTISPGYLVFVTPHGDSNSLYTQPSASGFTVRESKNGHSSLTFDYRIVAKPLDAKAAHLPLAVTHAMRTHLRPLRSAPVAQQ